MRGQRFLCLMVALGALMVPAARAHSEELVAGLWTEGLDDSSYVWGGVDWDGLLEKHNVLSRVGLRLADFEPYRDGASTRFRGVWRAGTGTQILFRGSWNDFTGQNEALVRRNMRLVKLHVEEDGGALTFSGLWSAGTDARYLWVGADEEGLRQKDEELAPQGLRLVDVETYEEGGRRKYAGVWRSGSDAHSVWVGLSLATFEAKIRGLETTGLRLSSFRVYRDHSDTKFLGVWRAGTRAQAFAAAPNWDSFRTRQGKIEIRPHLRLAGVSVCSGCGVRTFPPPAVGQPNARVIVSLGDSYASGEGVPDQAAVSCDAFAGAFYDKRTKVSCHAAAEWRASDPGTPEADSDRRCHRSGKAGPRLAARDFAQLAVSGTPPLAVQATSFACSGAEIMHITDSPYNGVDDPHDADVPAQLDQMRDRFPDARSFDAVIVSAGGNDVGFGDHVAWCALNPPWSKCYEHQPPEHGPFTQWEPAATLIARVKSRYRDLARALEEKLNGRVGNVFITEYPDPTRRSDRSVCGPPPLLFDAFDGVSRAEAQWAADVFIPTLNATLREVADEHGWHYVGNVAAPFSGATDPPSEAHGYCADDRWLNTLRDGVAIEGHPYGAVHPNEKGQRVYRDAIFHALLELAPPRAPVFDTTALPPQIAADAAGIHLAWSHFPERTAFYQVAYAFEELGRTVALPEDERPRPPGRAGDSPTLFVRDRPVPCTILHAASGGWCHPTALMVPPAPASLDSPSISGWFLQKIEPRPAFPSEAPAREWTHAVRGDAYYAVRACTTASCSDWSNVVWASNRP